MYPGNIIIIIVILCLYLGYYHYYYYYYYYKKYRRFSATTTAALCVASATSRRNLCAMCRETKLSHFVLAYSKDGRYQSCRSALQHESQKATLRFEVLVLSRRLYETQIPSRSTQVVSKENGRLRSTATPLSRSSANVSIATLLTRRHLCRVGDHSTTTGEDRI
jgi:hypothetical protein